MATITYKSLTALQPIELSYNYYKNESLIKKIQGYTEGYNFSYLEGLDNFQDLTINRNTCFILTSSIYLNNLFTDIKELTLGLLPGTINIQPRNSSIYYLGYDFDEDAVVSTFLDPQNFFIVPINNKEIEIKVGSFYLEVDDNYPYQIRANNLILTESQIRRRRFLFTYQNGIISLIAQTKDGNRYLALGNDNILRATGVIMGNNPVTDYIFTAKEVTKNKITYNFKPGNTWTTYYLDFTNQTLNTTTTINKKIDNLQTNFLISFPVGKHSNTAEINIASLKTNYTPTGVPATVDNTYTENIVTTN